MEIGERERGRVGDWREIKIERRRERWNLEKVRLRETESERLKGRLVKMQ